MQTKIDTSAQTVIIPQYLLETFPEKQTVIHFTMRVLSVHPNPAIWIEETSYLKQDNGQVRELLHALGIAINPEKTYITHYKAFTLVFEGLDDNCKCFDFIEPSTCSPFSKHDITRNQSDIYHIDLQFD